MPPDEAVASLDAARLRRPLRAIAATVTVAVPSWRNDVAGATPLDPSPDLPADRAAQAADGRDALEPSAT